MRTPRNRGRALRTPPRLQEATGSDQLLHAPGSRLPATQISASPLTAHRSPLTAHPKAFTLVEVLIGASLALMVMTAVLTTYVTIGRNFTRSLGISSANQPTLASQARRTLAYFAQDVRSASGISGTPSASSVSLTLPTSSGTTTVTYTYDSTAGTLTRAIGSSSLVLHSNLVTCTFNYYDNSNYPYTSFTNYLIGIRRISLSFSSQAGSSTNGTLTPIYQTDSPRLLLRNKQLLY